ncbi:MAG: alpha-1,2-fucosyltransferase [Spirochaetales bacterium]|nr:alpha-1,2-fucosyltransferase [Spirochaetales bacterium]
MIIVRLYGGMGNQMYQYAFARALGLRSENEVRLDLSYIKRFDRKNRVDSFALKHLSIETGESFLSKGIFGLFLHKRNVFRIFEFLDRILNKKPRHVLIEKKCEFNPEKKRIKAGFIYVYAGTWQSFRYFDDCEETIRREFRFNPVVQAECSGFAKIIRSYPNTVSVHIRRGDYVGKKETEYTQGICTEAYYEKAMSIMNGKVSNADYFFFSDDLPYVKKTFGVSDRFHYLDTDTGKSNKLGHRDTGYMDMYLMSLCRHHIIANSTFSWWAAYLNEFKDKIVVSPRRWYQGISDSKDILPESWVKI